MFMGSAWFLQRLIKAFFGNRASKVSLSLVNIPDIFLCWDNEANSALGEHSLYINLLGAKLAKNVSGIDIVNLKKIELRLLELPLRKF